MIKRFMQIAIEQAKLVQNDVPVGAVIVKDGEIIASAFNTKEKDNDVTAHAEIIALKKASESLNNWRLEECDFYVTLEPCPMCAWAIMQSRIKNIYFAATDEKGGGITSNARVFESDKHLWKPNVVQMPEYAGQSAEMLREFFQKRRNIKKETK